MTRWLQAAKQEILTGTELTKPTELGQRPVKSVKSVLSYLHLAEPAPAQTVNTKADAMAYLDRLHRHGPVTYGVMASTLGWGATRAWQAEARLRAAGLIRIGELGRAVPIHARKDGG